MSTPSREAHPEWVFDGPVRLPPRRKSKAPVGDDGLRAYMTCKCARGCGATVYVLEDTYSKNRKTAIDDHLADCPATPVADRPSKKARGFSAKQLASADTATLIPNVHRSCRARIEALEDDAKRKGEQIQTLQEQVSGLPANHSFMSLK